MIISRSFGYTDYRYANNSGDILLIYHHHQIEVLPSQITCDTCDAQTRVPNPSGHTSPLSEGNAGSFDPERFCLFHGNPSYPPQSYPPQE